MRKRSAVTLAGSTALALMVLAPPAMAACGDRPGTPNNLSAEVTSATSIRFKFQIRTRDNEVRKYYDYFVVEKPSNRQVVNRGGVSAHGPYYLGFGATTWFNVSDLKPGGEYCFQVRARTEPGTKGCVSEKWSGPACAKIEGGPSARPDAPGPWGALAADRKGRWGYGVGFASAAAARAAAVKGCGAGQCKVVVAGKARCYAYFESRQGGYWYGIALHSSLQTATSVARGGCTKGAPAGSCKQVKAACD
jgi:hypothetical protein